MNAGLTPFGTSHDRIHHRSRHLDTTGEDDQFRAPFVVRQRKLDRLVDPAGPGGKRRLQMVRPVGGQDEEDIGVFA